MRHAIPVLLAVVMLAACSSAQKKDLKIEALRSSLASLEQDERLQGLAPGALTEARLAVRRAEVAAESAAGRESLVYVAERRIELARARAELEFEQRREIELERAHDKMLVQSSLREAERAREAAERARRENFAQAEEAARLREEAQAARSEAAREAEERRRAQEAAADARRLADAQAEEARLARRKADLADAQAESLRRQLQNTQAQSTDRGLSVTLGNDVLFEVNQARLKDGAKDGIGRVIQLVNREYPERQVSVEGHTDSRGSADFNLKLSQERAENVKALLVDSGVAARRVSAVGLGEEFPVADNETEAGRAQNRRVEIILLEPGEE